MAVENDDRPRLVDLCCCAGGASEGYRRAGWNVLGVDSEPQPNYPFEFVQMDALAAIDELANWADAWHTSPPCHDHSDLARITGANGTGWLLPAIREKLKATGKPYVIENVEGADMPTAMMLCGTQFGLHTESRERGTVWLRRHRLFEASFPLVPPSGHRWCTRGKQVIGVYGNGDGGGRGWKGSFADRKAVMGIDWMTRTELAQSLPPAYTEFIGTQLLAQVRTFAAA